MKQKNTVTIDEISDGKAKNKKSFNYITFFKKYVFSKLFICVIVSIILTMILTISSVNHVKEIGCTAMYCSEEEITISHNFMSRSQVLLLTGVASMVPYFYLPILGFTSYMYSEIISVAHVINVYGYLMGILRYILPFALNVVSISLITSISLYMAKILTVKFRLSRINTMNFTKFRLRIYEMLKKQDKYDALYKKEQAKIKKLEESITKIKWKGVAITIGITVIIQFVAVVLQKVLI